MTTAGEWEAAGVNLDEKIEAGDLQSTYKAIVIATKKLVEHRCNELNANPSFTPAVTLEHIKEAEFIVKSIPKIRFIATGQQKYVVGIAVIRDGMTCSILSPSKNRSIR